MTGLVRKATLIAACGLLAAATAFANVPSPANSNFGSDVAYGDGWIPVVGTYFTPSTAGHLGQGICVEVRDFSNNPIAGSQVEIDFSGCKDINLCNLVIVGAGTVDCGAAGLAGNKVTGTTNALGQFCATIVGAGLNSGLSPGDPQGCVEVRADNVVIGNGSSYVLDQNGATNPGGGYPDDGHNGVDGSLVASDIANSLGFGVYVARCDFTKDGVVDGVDGATHSTRLSESLAGTGSNLGCDNTGASAPSYCP